MTSNHLLLYRLAELMLEHEQHILPVDLLFDDKQIGDFVKSIQIDSPYQQMLFEGVLTESVREEKLYVSFTVEGYFHFLLGSLLYNLSTDKSSDYFIDLISFNSLNGIYEGITECLIKQTTNSKFDCVVELIDKGETFINLCVAPLANGFTIQNEDKILSLLLQNETENDFSVLYQTISFLRKQNKIEIVDRILEQLVIEFKEKKLFANQFYFSRIRIASLIHEYPDELVKLAEEAIKKRNEILFEIDENILPRLLLDFYSILVNKGQLKLSTLFAFEFNIYDFESNILVDNYYNIIYPLLETGQFELAEKIFQRCKINNENNGVFINWSGFIFQSWYELKSQDPNHLETGLQLYEKSCKIIDKEFGVYSIRKYENLENLGYAYGLKGDYNKSLNYLNQAISIVSKSCHTEVIYPLGNLYEMMAVTLNELGEYADALEYTYKSDECKLLQVENNSPEMAWNHYDRSKIFMKMGNISEAKNSMILALTIRENSLGIDNELTIQTRKEFEEITNAL
jgi:tetratricopeptide (TPR) repeat protein